MHHNLFFQEKETHTNPFIYCGNIKLLRLTNTKTKSTNPNQKEVHQQKKAEEQQKKAEEQQKKDEEEHQQQGNLALIYVLDLCPVADIFTNISYVNVCGTV